VSKIKKSCSSPTNPVQDKSIGNCPDTITEIEGLAGYSTSCPPYSHIIQHNGFIVSLYPSDYDHTSTILRRSNRHCSTIFTEALWLCSAHRFAHRPKHFPNHDSRSMACISCAFEQQYRAKNEEFRRDYEGS